MPHLFSGAGQCRENPGREKKQLVNNYYMMTDPIADTLTRIRNASLARKAEVAVPYSKLKMAIVKVLEQAGYILKSEQKKGKFSYILIALKYEDGRPAIRSLNRISRPGCRRYVKYADIKPVLSGYGLSIYSTPRGILTGAEARRLKVGGELICEVY